MIALGTARLLCLLPEVKGARAATRPVCMPEAKAMAKLADMNVDPGQRTKVMRHAASEFPRNQGEKRTGLAIAARRNT